MKRELENWFNRIWYERRPPLFLLPLEYLFILLSALRRAAFALGIRRSSKPPVPVVVIGNITVGGTGKTPLIARLAGALSERGWKPGIISRGYGSRSRRVVVKVAAASPVAEAGDEPLLLARETGLPVYVHPRRAMAAAALFANEDCDLILSDDGLQHYALGRDIEIAVVDSKRGLGNGHRLPAGPLREAANRLESVDFVVTQGEDDSDAVHMQLAPVELVNLTDGRKMTLAEAAEQEWLAAAGIANPQRFFETLMAAGIPVTEKRAFPDHHAFGLADLAFADDKPLLMTAKDAVKCREFARPGWWYLRVEAVFDKDIVAMLDARLKQVRNSEKES